MKIPIRLLVFALVSGSILFVSCNNENSSGETSSDTTATTKDEAEDQNDSALATKAAEKDAQFVVDVVAFNYGEVKLAKLAQQKSSNKELKDAAKMIETDHLAVLSDLKNIAIAKSITVPTEENGEAKDRVKDLSDDKAGEFDKEWLETLLDSHKNSISKFENAANDVSDPALKNFVNTVLPKLRIHHDKLMECHKKLK